MNGTTGFSRYTLNDLLGLVEHKEYADDEGFWLAKELRQQIGSKEEHAYNEGYLDGRAGER